MGLTLLFTLNGFSQDPTITKVFELNQPGTLNASSSGGGIQVTTHDQPNAEIQAFVRRNGRLLSSSDRDLNENFDLNDFLREIIKTLPEH